jgi:hypothetical protein
MDGIVKTNKMGYSGHFAECNTRQRSTLPSVKVISLGKEALCRVSRSYHSAKKAHLGTGKASLLSAVALALGKEASFIECLLVHSAKELTKGSASDPFAEC